MSQPNSNRVSAHTVHKTTTTNIHRFNYIDAYIGHTHGNASIIHDTDINNKIYSFLHYICFDVIQRQYFNTIPVGVFSTHEKKKQINNNNNNNRISGNIAAGRFTHTTNQKFILMHDTHTYNANRLE